MTIVNDKSKKDIIKELSNVDNWRLSWTLVARRTATPISTIWDWFKRHKRNFKITVTYMSDEDMEKEEALRSADSWDKLQDNMMKEMNEKLSQMKKVKKMMVLEFAKMFELIKKECNYKEEEIFEFLEFYKNNII